MNLSEVGYEVVRDAVNLARDESIRHVAELRNRLRQIGHSEEAIREGLRYWAAEERKS
ncbi:hypothetical protein [Pandoraea communis]|uniref:hypothetical protein n=1 Tax=Pandoraea communis TaxID=2508297 RepID=UPI0025A62185|nr:hypothetical protein [Pandoraea communis]MDM8358817.1 hypothetical protein [Pandoraea communis]